MNRPLVNPSRRLLMGGALAAAAVGPALATPSLHPLATRQVRAGELDVGYHEVGPADGIPVLLLHGYPYDIHSYVDVAPLLAARGCRVIVPMATVPGAMPSACRAAAISPALRGRANSSSGAPR